MKTLTVIAMVFASSAVVMSLILFIGMRGGANKGGKVPRFLLSLLFAATAVLIFGFGLRFLPEKKIVPLCLLALAWGFGSCVPVGFAARKLFKPFATNAKAPSKSSIRLSSIPGGRGSA